MKRTRFSLFLIAALLAVTTLSLGLTNTLTDYETFSAVPVLAKTGDFGITLSQPTLDPILFPGQDYDFNVTVTSGNRLPAYLIAQVELPTDFVADGNAVFSPSGWERLETDLNGQALTGVYYYGEDGEKSVLTESTTLISKIRLADYVEILPANAADIDYPVNIQVWAFQKTDETVVMSPGELWEEVKNTWLSEP